MPLLGLTLFTYMTVCFFIGLIKKRNDIADVAWGLGFVLLAWLSFVRSDTHSLQALLINCLVTLWGLRLSIHIFKRHQHKPEDSRYAEWRQQWHYFNLRAYFQIYILQGCLLFLIALPIIFINESNDIRINWLDLIGILVWILGFLFESIADKQLADFSKNPANRGLLIQSGLWQYSRHPNYFGEVVQWWALWIIALSSEHPWLSLISPITITFLILKVSGIPMLEDKMKYKPGFERYAKETNAFFPWKKKKAAFKLL